MTWQTAASRSFALTWPSSPRRSRSPVAERRAQYERAEKLFPTPAEIKVEHVTAGAAPAEWLRAPSARAGRVVLYLHGGGYVLGSPRYHRHLAAAIAVAAGADALLLDYRLAPEHPFPAAVEDAVAAYRWLLDQGIAPAGWRSRVTPRGRPHGRDPPRLGDAALPLPGGRRVHLAWVDLKCRGATSLEGPVDPIVQ